MKADKRIKQPDDLKELVRLCRTGHLAEVQQWLESGKSYLLPDHCRGISPFRVAVQTGFYSLIEVFLKAGVPQPERDRVLHEALSRKRLDLLKLLVGHGADIASLCDECIFASADTQIFQFLIENGYDWNADLRITRAFKKGVRKFLRFFMMIRASVPSAEEQAAIALRHFVRKNQQQSAFLLLWAVVDPRRVVPDPEYPDERGTALEDAVSYGRTQFVEKIGIDPKVDDPTRLLHQILDPPDPGIVGKLLDLGARWCDPEYEYSPINRLLHTWSWLLGNGHSKRQPALECLLLLASRGAKWVPRDEYEISNLRRSIVKMPRTDVVSGLTQMADAGLFEPGILHEVLRTPKVRQFIEPAWGGKKLLGLAHPPHVAGGVVQRASISNHR